MRRPRKPTDTELAILRALWANGPATVRQVADAMGRQESYTTILKLLQIMTDKGLVTRDQSERSHVYTAAMSKAQTQKQLVSDLLARAFDGSAAKLVLHALASGKASAQELAEIRALIDRHRESRK